MHSRHWTEPSGHSGHHPRKPTHTGCAQWPDHRPRALSGSQQQSGLHLHNPSLMSYYSFNRPWRDGRLSWPCWLTDSSRFYPQSGHTASHQSTQDRESSPARTGGLTTMLRHRYTGVVSIACDTVIWPITNCQSIWQSIYSGWPPAAFRRRLGLCAWGRGRGLQHWLLTG